MERKELEAESIGTWDMDIGECTDYHQYYPQDAADAVMDSYESQIKNLREINSILESLVIDKNHRIEELENYIPRWISVNDAEKPCNNETVILINENTLSQAVAVYKDGNFWQSVMPESQITHWMHCSALLPLLHRETENTPGNLLPLFHMETENTPENG